MLSRLSDTSLTSEKDGFVLPKSRSTMKILDNKRSRTHGRDNDYTQDWFTSVISRF